jgi:uncharacterized protein YndB with AHSA1/START domain
MRTLQGDFLMRMVFRTKIDRPASAVWKNVITAEKFQKWNDKIKTMDARGEFRLGEPFMTAYNWRNKITQCMSVVTNIVPERILELRQSNFVGVGVDPRMEASEKIILEEKGGGTRVTRVLSIRHHGVPIILAPILWFVSRFGKPTEPDPLKTMCEAGP